MSVLTNPFTWLHDTLDRLAPVNPDPPAVARTGIHRIVHCAHCEVRWNANHGGDHCWNCTRQGTNT